MPERIFHALARRAPAAVVLTGGGASITARGLLAAVDALAEKLARHGRHTLAVLADNGPAWVAADLAALKCRIAHLPLPPFFSPEQLHHALTATGADALLTDRPETVRAALPDFAPLDQWQGLHLLGRAATAPDLPVGIAKISFTSGSTGTPKGVCLSAAGLVDTAQSVTEALADLPLQRHLAVLPLALLLENVAGVYAPLLRGMSIDLPSLATLGWRGMAAFDSGCLHARIAAARPHSLILVPELLKALTHHLASQRLRAPQELTFAAVGGARCDPLLIATARQRGLPAYEGYGMTECGSVVCLNRPGADRPGSVGRPLPGVTIDAVAGEIVVAGRPFLGYLGETGGAFSHWPTGDLGRVDAAGYVHLSGRRGNLIITGFGRNVSPEWIESTLTAQPAIAQAVVVGEAKPWLAAIVVPGGSAGEADIRAAVNRANAGLPDYARIRQWLVATPFSAGNGLATGNGRPRRQAIHRHHQASLEQLYKETT